MNQSFFLWGGFSVTIIAAIFCASLYLCLRKRIYVNFQRHMKQKGGLGSLDEEMYRLRQYKLEEVKKATNNFSLDCLVGSGAYGNVYKGSFGVEGTLAVKKIHTDSYVSCEEFRNGAGSETEIPKLIAEIYLGGVRSAIDLLIRLLIGWFSKFSLFALTDSCPWERSLRNLRTTWEYVEGSIVPKQFGDAPRLALEISKVKLLAKVTHTNLVQLRGFSSETGRDGAKILMYEYVSNGSLLDYLIGKGGRSLSWEQRVHIAITAAKGIAHLHEGIEPSIIHRDIKPSNILIGDHFQAKISDFGLVKAGPSGEDQSHVSTQVKGTPGYLDPAYCASLHLSPFSDVYSFGVILLQLVTGRPAVDINGNQPNNHIIDWATPHLEQGSVGDILDANLLLEPCNTEMMLKMGQLGLKCVKKAPKERPTMTRVWKELQAALYHVETIKTERPQKSLKTLSQLPDHSSNDSHEDNSCSVSINGIGLQRFQVEMDSFSFQSTNLRCLEL